MEATPADVGDLVEGPAVRGSPCAPRPRKPCKIDPPTDGPGAVSVSVYAGIGAVGPGLLNRILPSTVKVG
jgi:hypothetical protein